MALFSLGTAVGLASLAATGLFGIDTALRLRDRATGRERERELDLLAEEAVPEPEDIFALVGARQQAERQVGITERFVEGTRSAERLTDDVLSDTVQQESAEAQLENLLNQSDRAKLALIAQKSLPGPSEIAARIGLF